MAPEPSIWNGSQGPIPPVMTADTAIALMPSSNPNRGPNATPTRMTTKKIPLPPSGRETSRSSPPVAASTPSTATVIPVIVPRRNSSASAVSASAPMIPAQSGASPLWARFGTDSAGNQNGYRNAAAPTIATRTYTSAGRNRATTPLVRVTVHDRHARSQAASSSSTVR